MTQDEIIGITAVVLGFFSWGIILGMYIEKWKR